MSKNDEYDTASTQKFAWLVEIFVLKEVLKAYQNENCWVAFEYTIPRIGKRIDAVVLLRERVFVLEFKAGEDSFNRQDIDQVLDYALDLKNFHQGSSDRMIVPVLVATESLNHSKTIRLSHYNDGIYEPLLSNREGLLEVFQMVLNEPLTSNQFQISLSDWIRSRRKVHCGATCFR